MTQRYIVPSLDRAVQVLTLLSKEEKGLSLADLGRRSGIPKSSLFRILTTLRVHDFVQWSENEHSYRLGHYIWELGRGFVDQCEPYRVAEPHMNRLSEATGETVFLAKMEGRIMVYLRRVDGTKAVAMMRNLGQSTPIFCTASGRAILANLPETEAESVLDSQEIVAHTEKTVIDRAKLIEKLSEVRRLGYSVVDAEYNRELLCISAPVFDHENRPCAALTLAMLSSQGAQSGIIGEYAPQVRESASAFSRDLGFLGERAA